MEFVRDDTTEPNPPETEVTIAEARAAVGTDRTVQIQGTVTTTPGSREARPSMYRMRQQGYMSSLVLQKQGA